jgi:hypothetical protein
VTNVLFRLAALPIVVALAGCGGTTSSPSTIAVTPNFQGSWQGTYTVQSCAQSGAFAESNFCATLPGSAQTALTLTQSQNTVSGSFSLGTIAFPAFTGQIDANGTLTFTATSTTDPAITAAWVTTVAADGRLTGNITQIWRLATATGEGRLETSLTSVTKVSAPPLAPDAVTPAV